MIFTNTTLLQRDVHHLAKLAVSGDESALDMFGWKRNQKTMLRIDPAEAIFYLVGTKEGTIYTYQSMYTCIIMQY